MVGGGSVAAARSCGVVRSSPLERDGALLHQETAKQPATPVTEPMLCHVSGRGFVTATNPAAKRHCAR
jgi:hypothetical protein